MTMTFRPDSRITSFHPPQRTLLGPGPTDIHPRVLSALSRPIIGYLDPVLFGMMEELKALLREAFQTGNSATFPVSGPGSVGMEMCFVNLVSPGDKVVVCRNGVFGGRMIEMVQRCGGVPVVVEEEWGKPVDPEKLEDALGKNRDARLVAFVQAETSTGVLSDAKSLAAIARRHDCLTIVDAVTSLGGAPLRVDEWGIDACYSASQKCLSCTPGLSPVTFSDRLVERVKARKDKPRGWFMDLDLLLGYWAGPARTYHHTPPANSLYALHEALIMLHEEGLEDSWARHQRNYEALEAGLEALGFSFLVKREHRLPQITAVLIPEGIDEKEVRRRLLAYYGLEIGAGLGDFAGKVWRFGIMGYSSRVENVLLCLGALEAVLSGMGMSVDLGAAESAAFRAYAAQPAHPRSALGT
jgi:alanine-glyoxylate transaminase / serine-glyoxylate transaminase / serine-pyruvate transaminase